MPPTTSASLLDDLRSRIHGRVIGPADPDYGATRGLVYGGADKRPAAIARVRDAADVSAVVTFVREAGLPVSVRSGGHGAAAYAIVDDGIVIDVRDMKAIELDVDGRAAWAEAGLTAVEFSRVVGEHGLAVGFGDTGSVGLGGITLGGGVGYLVRKFGLTIDSLLAAELVTADGEIWMVDASHEPDLFWAIRGAGANFGVATRFRFRLSDVPEFTGGLLVLPATGETLAGFLAAADAAPEELSTIANVMPCPPLPMAPEAWHGRLVVFALMAYVGPQGDAAAALAPFRALAEPVADLVHPSPYVEIYPPDDPDYHPLAVARTAFIDRSDLAVATRIVDTLEAAEAPFRVAQLRVLGGASARVPAEATAYAHRDRKVMVNIAAFYDGAHDREVRRAWVDAFHADLTGGDLEGYVNFLDDEGEARIRAAYPHGAHDRLAALKARWDPTNLFRSNQNICPAG